MYICELCLHVASPLTHAQVFKAGPLNAGHKQMVSLSYQTFGTDSEFNKQIITKWIKKNDIKQIAP